MSKSLYQYKFNPEQRDLLHQVLVRAINDEQYLDKKGMRQFDRGNGWLTAKRRIEYRISEDILHICICKVIAMFVPSWEMGYGDADSFLGCLLNNSLKETVNRIAAKVHAVCPLIQLVNCYKVDNNFLMTIPEPPLANPYAQPNPQQYAQPNPQQYPPQNPQQ
ncbi:MAG: hypothetical protein IJY93_08325 [Clostridia bacterium]|nr:hypothetical protein [Clostridia bacterium]